MPSHAEFFSSNEVNSSPLRLVTWNTTPRCNLSCSHCYINANGPKDYHELSTVEGFSLIDQIAEVGRPIVVLSGGEPLLRNDIFDLARYGTDRGLRMTMGTNGTLIDGVVAKRLRDSGIKRAAISLDSSSPTVHDEIRGMDGAWARSLEGIRACLNEEVGVQANITVSMRNHQEIGDLLDMVKELGVRDVHLFFLVPTGRGEIKDTIEPEEYESLIEETLGRTSDELTIRPTCAPQFIRIAKQMGLDTSRWNRGCIAGINYCRILYNGMVTPCPYLDLVVGDIRGSTFSDIWNDSTILRAMRDPKNLKGKCGRCEYKGVCGGCRARAFGMAQIKAVGSEAIFGEDPWCLYDPRMGEQQ